SRPGAGARASRVARAHQGRQGAARHPPGSPVAPQRDAARQGGVRRHREDGGLMHRTAAVMVLALCGAVPAWAGEIERLRAENQRLQQRVQQLEAENAQLRARGTSGDTELAKALQERATETVTVSPGEEPGTSRVETEPSRLEGVGGAKGRHWITWRADRATDGGGAAGGASLILNSSASGGLYRDVRSVRLLVDGTPVEVVVADYHTHANTTVRDSRAYTLDETVTATVPMATLDQLVAAHDVSGTLGPPPFRPSPEHLAPLPPSAN